MLVSYRARAAARDGFAFILTILSRSAAQTWRGVKDCFGKEDTVDEGSISEALADLLLEQEKHCRYRGNVGLSDVSVCQRLNRSVAIILVLFDIIKKSIYHLFVEPLGLLIRLRRKVVVVINIVPNATHTALMTFSINCGP